MRPSKPRAARQRRLVEQIVASKRALLETSAEERALATRQQRALSSLTATRYRAKAAHDAGEAKEVRRAEALARRQEALVRTLTSDWKRCQGRLAMREADFRDTSRRLVGPPEPPPRIVMRGVKTAHAHARALLDEIEALLRTTWELHEAAPGSLPAGFNRKVMHTLSNAETSLIDARLWLATATAVERSLAKRHRQETADANCWRGILADHTEHGDHEQAASLAPMISRFEKEAAAIELCWTAQRESVARVQGRLAAVLELLAEAKRMRPILSSMVTADRSLAIARKAVAAARVNAHGVRAKASFDEAKKCVVLVIADERRLARYLEETRDRGAATDAIERSLTTQRQAKDDLLRALRALAYPEGPPN